MSSRTSKQLTNIGALWHSKTRTGDAYLKGSITLPSGEKLDIQIYANKFTGQDRPDLIIYTNADLWEVHQAMINSDAGGSMDAEPF